MTQLTWQNVSVPQFDVGANFSRANELISGALSGVGSAANGLDQARTDRILGGIRSAVNGAGSVDAAQTLLHSGQIGGYNLADPEIAKRIDPATIQAMIDGRIKGQENVTAYGQKTAFDKLAPEIYRADALLNSPLQSERDEGRKLRDSLDSTGLSASQVQNLVTNGQGVESTAMGNANSAFDQLQKVTNFNNQKAAEKAIQDINQQVAPGDAGGVERMLQTGGYSPQVEALLRSHFGTGGAGAVGGGGVPGAAGAPGGVPSSMGPLSPSDVQPAGGGGPNYSRVVADVQVPGMPDPATMTIAQWGEYGPKIQKATLALPMDKRRQLGLDGADSPGSSAMGGYQILGSSTAQQYAKRFGWSPDTVMDAAHQEYMAKAIYEDAAKNGTMAKVFPSVATSFPKGTDFKALPWEQARLPLAGGEGGRSGGSAVSSNPQGVREAGVVAANALAAQATKNDPRGIVAKITALRADPANAGLLASDVADQLRATGGKDSKAGAFAGTDKGALVDRLNQIVQDSGGSLSYAEAGVLLSSNLAGGKHFGIPIPDLRFGTGKALPFTNLDLSKFMPGTNLGTGGNVRVNQDGLKADVGLVRNLGQKGLQDAMLTDFKVAQARKQTALAQTLVEQSADTLRNMRIRQTTVQPNLDLAPYEAAAAAAQLQMVQLQRQQSINPTYGGAPPAAPQPVAKTVPAARAPAAKPAPQPANKAPLILAGYGD